MVSSLVMPGPAKQPCAGQHVQEPGVGVGEVELVDGVDELVPALGDDQLAVQQVLGEPGRLQQPAGDGEHRADATVRGIEAVVARRSSRA